MRVTERITALYASTGANGNNPNQLFQMPGRGIRILPIPGPSGQPVSFPAPRHILLNGGPQGRVAVASTDWLPISFTDFQFDVETFGQSANAYDYWIVEIQQEGPCGNDHDPLGSGGGGGSSSSSGQPFGTFAYNPATGLFTAPGGGVVASPMVTPGSAFATTGSTGTVTPINAVQPTNGYGRIKIPFKIANTGAGALSFTAVISDASGNQYAFTDTIPVSATQAYNITWGQASAVALVSTPTGGGSQLAGNASGGTDGELAIGNNPDGAVTFKILLGSGTANLTGSMVQW